MYVTNELNKQQARRLGGGSLQLCGAIQCPVVYQQFPLSSSFSVSKFLNRLISIWQVSYWFCYLFISGCHFSWYELSWGGGGSDLCRFHPTTLLKVAERKHLQDPWLGHILMLALPSVHKAMGKFNIRLTHLWNCVLVFPQFLILYLTSEFLCGLLFSVFSLLWSGFLTSAHRHSPYVHTSVSICIYSGMSLWIYYLAGVYVLLMFGG